MSRTNYTKFGEGICQSSALPTQILHFRYIATIQKQYTSKATKIKNQGQILDFFPLKKFKQ